MQNMIATIGALALLHAGCSDRAEASGEAPPTKKLYLDVHHLGAGKVTTEAAAGAHQKDLATQEKYGANFKAYWVDERQGDIYCLVEAPSAEAAISVHREAHGLLPDSIAEVTEGR